MAAHLLRLNFSSNWNGKLYTNCFTTLRRWNPNRYRINDCYRVFLNEEEQGTAQLIGVKRLKTSEINNYIGHLDTGYDAQKTRGIILKMYKTHEDIEMGFYLFKFIRRIPHTKTNVKKPSV